MKRLLLLLLFSALTNATELLPADKAFAFKAKVDNNQILLRWDIAPGYYLYKEKIQVSSNAPNNLGVPEIPAGKLKNDDFFGTVEIYRNSVVVSISILSDKQKTIVLDVSYQGCADLGVCYPPINQSVTLDIPAGVKLSPVSLATNIFSTAKKSVQSALETVIPLEEEHPLPPDQAFQLSVTTKDKNTLIARWDIKPNYYLYHDKFLIDVKGADLGNIDFPKGKIKDDALFGKVEVHTKQLEVAIPLKNVQTSTIHFTAGYQGCWEGGVCYPPQAQTLDVVLTNENIKTMPATNTATTTPAPTNSPSQSAITELNEADKITALLQQDSLLWVLLSFFGFGLLLSLTPCVFPMIPILSGIIIGQKETISTKKALAMSVVFVLAMSITYAGAGVLAGYFGENLQVLFQTPWVLILFSLVFVALAFSMFGYYDIQLPASMQTKIAKISNQQKSGDLLGVAIMGLLSALIVGPCVAPPLAGALIYIGQTGDALLGGLSLFVMSLGMGVPLLAIGTGVSKLPKAGAWMDNIKVFFGILMLAVAIYLLDRIISDITSLILWALLFTIAPIAMGALEQAKTPWQRIFKAIGLIVLGYGILLFSLVARGGGDMFAPLAGWGSTNTQVETTHVKFKPVQSNGELDGVLARAQQNNQVVVMDFYADWCIACKELERFVFANTRVVDAMRPMIALQADVTRNNAEDKALMARFDIIGPPAILFFKNGVEMRAKRIIGEINAQNFLTHLNSI